VLVAGVLDLLREGRFHRGVGRLRTAVVSNCKKLARCIGMRERVVIDRGVLSPLLGDGATTYLR
jgi:hypothetical protein